MTKRELLTCIDHLTRFDVETAAFMLMEHLTEPAQETVKNRLRIIAEPIREYTRHTAYDAMNRRESLAHLLMDAAMKLKDRL